MAEDVLQDRIGQMQQHVPPLVSWFLVEREALPCVACGEAMQTLALFEVPVDRCRGHGVWFDAEELASVLLRSKDALDDACPVPTRAAPGQPTQRTQPTNGGALGSGTELALDVALVAVHLPIEVATGGIPIGAATEVGGAAMAVGEAAAEAMAVGGAAVDAMAVGGVAVDVGGAAVEAVASGAAEAGLGIVGGVLEGILDGLASLLA